MNGFDKLLQCWGEWAGRNRVQPFVNDPVNESSSRLTITPVLGGMFVRLDQQWSWEDKTQLGSMLIGCLPNNESATINWIDTWHNGRSAMNLLGRFEPHDKLIAHGSFPVEGEADWGWRIEIEVGDDQLSINMFCINPATKNEEGWVWSNFTRVRDIPRPAAG